MSFFARARDEAEQSQCLYAYVDGVIERKLVIPTVVSGDAVSQSNKHIQRS